MNKIYIVLGENGSGKSTFIRTLLGFLKPISGKINLKSPKNETVKIGFCPQHDIIINNLTVKEQLKFYWSLKTGKSNELIDKNINEYFSIDLDF